MSLFFFVVLFVLLFIFLKPKPKFKKREETPSKPTIVKGLLKKSPPKIPEKIVQEEKVFVEEKKLSRAKRLFNRKKVKEALLLSEILNNPFLK